jgi:hypothetical protein
MKDDIACQQRWSRLILNACVGFGRAAGRRGSTLRMLAVHLIGHFYCSGILSLMCNSQLKRVVQARLQESSIGASKRLI